MSAPTRISRRRLSGLVAAILPAIPQLARGQVFDQGIGGTGAANDPKDEPSDTMIGGTGVVGTIRRFGSIYVNELRITYPDNFSVTQDDAHIGTKDLKLGQVVRVAAGQVQNDLVARSIRVLHEVVGPVHSIGATALTVLGQRVSLDNKPDLPTLKVGQHVAVSGLRRLDGTIVASRIDVVEPGRLRVAGPLVRSPQGTLTVGGLNIAKLDPALVGSRVYLAGQMAGSRLTVTDYVTERDALASLGTPQLSLEAYVTRSTNGLRLGSGLHVGGDPAGSDTEELAVLTVAFQDRAHLVAEKIEVATPTKSATPTARDEERQTRERANQGGDKDGHDHASGRGGSEGHGGGRGHR